MMRTEAPKDFAGRGVANLARTTPELPIQRVSQISTALRTYPRNPSTHTMWSGNLAPDNADLSAANLLLTPVDERNLLAKVEAVSNRQFLRLYA